jgi:Rne/Rng family ribonuclease
MNKEMIIASNGHETRVAILEDDQLAELFVEREQHRGVVGNVYKGRVSKVLPGMQSSFVDIGLERDGFLYVSDVIANLESARTTKTRRFQWFRWFRRVGANGAEGATGSSAPLTGVAVARSPRSRRP